MPVYTILAEHESISRSINHKTKDAAMQLKQKNNVITLSKHQAFEKSELFTKKTTDKCLTERNRVPVKKNMDFIETLFQFLGNKRGLVISYIKMKLDPRARRLFNKEIKACLDLRDECRCVKRYFGRLKTKDAKALIVGLPDMMPGKIEALIYHGETEPENRLKKFVKTFSLSEADVTCCMLLLMLTRESAVGHICEDVAAPLI
jgi:hypothetical protein